MRTSGGIVRIHRSVDVDQREPEQGDGRDPQAAPKLHDVDTFLAAGLPPAAGLLVKLRRPSWVSAWACSTRRSGGRSSYRIATSDGLGYITLA
jgi:hypothetical protein